MAERNGCEIAEKVTTVRSVLGNVALMCDTSGKQVEVIINNVLVAKITSAGVLDAGELCINASTGKVGATAGWACPSAHSGFTNASVVGLPASQTASTWVVPVSGLKVGQRIVSFKVAAQIESAGGAVTLDADLRKLTNAAANATDASIGAITQVSVTADTAVAASKTLATAETVAADEVYYVLLTGTTAASTDIQLLGITVTTDVP